jgi:chromosome partitioning protein
MDDIIIFILFHRDITMTTITMATSKGGAGKTTIAQLLIGTLADRGHRIAAIDIDRNRTLATWVEALSRRPVTIRAETDETEIVPLATELEATHDLLVIDTAGAASRATVFAIGCADLVLVPLQPSSSDVIEAIKTIKLVRSASEMTRREIPARVVFTDYQPSTRIAVHTEGEVARYGLPTLATKLSRLVAFKEMTFTGEMPSGGAARAAVDELLTELKALGALPFIA